MIYFHLNCAKAQSQYGVTLQRSCEKHLIITKEIVRHLQDRNTFVIAITFIKCITSLQSKRAGRLIVVYSEACSRYPLGYAIGTIIFFLYIKGLTDLQVNNILILADDAGLICPTSDLNSLKFGLLISWAWFVKHQLPLIDSKSNNIAMRDPT